MRAETHVKCSLLLSDFNQNCDNRYILVKLPNISFHENLFSLPRIVTRGPTDAQEEVAMLMSTVLQRFVVNTPEII
jgi:hypothetical protein